MDPDACNCQMQNKVMFDLRFYFCRRGNEMYMHGPSQLFDLKFETDTAITYLQKVIDKMTKNHKETDAEVQTGFMHQMLDTNGQPHKYCPICSFENYVGHLNPNVKNLWQTPINKLSDLSKQVWYMPEGMGHNPIEKFMGKMSKMCQLSQHYTNHCIRVTGGTRLQRDGQSTAKQIMSVTGHKSVQSLAVYQHVKEDKKLMLGMSLTYSLLHPQEVQETSTAMANHRDKHTNPSVSNLSPTNIVQPHALGPNVPQLLPLDSALVPFGGTNKEKTGPKDVDTNFDIMSILAEFDAPDDDQLVVAASQIENQSVANTTKMVTMIRKNTGASLQHTFHNCTFGLIGTLNIHVHKN